MTDFTAVSRGLQAILPGARLSVAKNAEWGSHILTADLVLHSRMEVTDAYAEYANNLDVLGEYLARGIKDEMLKLIPDLVEYEAAKMSYNRFDEWGATGARPL